MPNSRNNFAPWRHTNYECTKERHHFLGKGAFGEVYKGVDKRTLKVVAIKFCTSSISNRQAVLRETEILTRLKHDNIVECFSIETDITDSTKIMIVMELCTGTVREYLQEAANRVFGVSHREFLDFFKDVTQGLRYLKSENIVHRDLKPENIMRSVSRGNKTVYKLADFGAARELQSGETFQTICGTAYFLHPKIHKCCYLSGPRNKRFGENVDLWALATTLYNVATNKLPFKPCYLAEEIFKLSSEKVISITCINNERILLENLPATCRLHPNLKILIEDFVAILMRIDLNDPNGFNIFYGKTDEILKWKTVKVFNVNDMKIHELFTKPDDFLKKFQIEFKDFIPSCDEKNVLIISSNSFVEQNEHDCIYLFKPLEYLSGKSSPVKVDDETKIHVSKFADYFTRKLTNKGEKIIRIIQNKKNILKDFPEIIKMTRHSFLHGTNDLKKILSTDSDINEWLSIDKPLKIGKSTFDFLIPIIAARRIIRKYPTPLAAVDAATINPFLGYNRRILA